MKIYLQDHNNILTDVAKELNVTRDFEEADKVVLWQDVIGFGRGIAQLARKKGKPVIVVQHGANSHIDYGPPNHYKLLADKYCVWGTRSRDALLSYGIPASKIVITGSTIFSHIKPKVKHNKINVVFRPAHWDIRILEENKIVAEALRNIDYGLTITTKIIETIDPTGLDNVVSSHRDKPGHLEACVDILSTADLVVGIAEDGTFEMLAYAMDVPVVIPNVWKQKVFLGKATPEMNYSIACNITDMRHLESVIKENLDNPDKLKAERRSVAEEWAGIHIEDPLQKILKVIHDA